MHYCCLGSSPLHLPIYSLISVVPFTSVTSFTQFLLVVVSSHLRSVSWKRRREELWSSSSSSSSWLDAATFPTSLESLTINTFLSQRKWICLPFFMDFSTLKLKLLFLCILGVAGVMCQLSPYMEFVQKGSRSALGCITWNSECTYGDA